MSADEGADAAELAPQNPKSGRLSHLDRERMLAMHAAGASHDEIAQATQRTTGLIQKTLAAAAPKKKKQSPAPTRRAAKPVAATPPPAGPSRPARDTSLRHRYWLRPQTQIELELPADLRAHEAERLANYLQALAFGARAH